jgi:hypothetical protein
MTLIVCELNDRSAVVTCELTLKQKKNLKKIINQKKKNKRKKKSLSPSLTE